MEAIFIKQKEEYILLILSNGKNYGSNILKIAKEKKLKHISKMGCEIYRYLHRLHNKGLVLREEDNNNIEKSTGRPRAYYSITQKGKYALQQEKLRRSQLTDQNDLDFGWEC